MCGRDPVNKLSAILNTPRRYLCDDAGLPDLEALKNMYQMVAQQLYNSRQCYIKNNKYNKVPDHGILVGDLVLVKDHTAKSFEPKDKEDYHVVQIYGTNALQVSDKRGILHIVHITDVRCINMTEKVTTQLEQRKKSQKSDPTRSHPRFRMEHRPTRKKPANTTKRKTTRGYCNPNYTYPGGGTPKQ